MIHRCVIAVSDWLRDPNTAPNAYLAGLTLEEEDAGLALPAVAIVLDPFRDDAAFTNAEPGRYPAWYVTPASPVDVQGEVNQNEQDGDGLDLLVRLVVEELASAKALRIVAYQMTALNRSISAFFAETVEGRAARERGHVQIISCLSRSYALAYEDLGAAKVVGAMVIRLSTRDTEAT